MNIQKQQNGTFKENQYKKAEKQLIKSAKGITLIALVITIIVLLILSGITIAMLVGENRNINQYKQCQYSQYILWSRRES